MIKNRPSDSESGFVMYRSFFFSFRYCRTSLHEHHLTGLRAPGGFEAVEIHPRRQTRAIEHRGVVPGGKEHINKRRDLLSGDGIDIEPDVSCGGKGEGNGGRGIRGIGGEGDCGRGVI